MFAQNIACRAAVAKASLRLPCTSGCKDSILARDIIGIHHRIRTGERDTQLTPLFWSTGPAQIESRRR